MPYPGRPGWAFASEGGGGGGGGGGEWAYVYVLHSVIQALGFIRE